MKLIDAVRPNPRTRLAFVGAGGKLEAMFRLAGQIADPVICYADTNFDVDQYDMAVRHYFVRTREDLTPLRAPLQDGITLVTYEEGDEKPGGGWSVDLMEELNKIAYSHNSPLLMTLNGSSHKSFLVPFFYNQQLPHFVNTVIVSVGLTDLGKSLSEACVNQPKLFGELAGLKLGETITPQAIVNVLTHSDGVLKTFNHNVHCLVMITHADTPEKVAIARGMVEGLQKSYHVVLVSDLIRQQDEIKAAFVRVAGVVLAAGESKRMRQPKQLLEWQGQSFIRIAADKALRAGLDPVLVVTGAYKEAVEQAIGDLGVEVIHNPRWEAGQSTSVKTAIDTLPEGIGAAIFFLVDQPRIPINFIRTLIETHARTLAPIVAPMVDHQRNNPVLFDRITFRDLSGIEGDVGGRQIFSKHQVTWVPWVDSSEFVDVDTMDDYQKLTE